jgi:hypothetical protein
MADSTTLKDPPKIASNKPMVAPMAPANPDPAAEATPQQRLEALLASIKANYAHNAPIAPAHISELDALVRLGRGDKSMVPSHNFPNDVMIAKPDGTVAVVWSAEQALDYVRALPDDVRNRPYWVAAEKALLSSMMQFQRIARTPQLTVPRTNDCRMDVSAMIASPTGARRLRQRMRPKKHSEPGVLRPRGRAAMGVR